jgi:parvulin-like peptidyl-prolyl isomerase
VTKRILAVLGALLLAGTVGLVAGCGGNLPNDAVAKVGNSVITQEEFDQRIADFEAQYAGQIPDKSSDPDNYNLFQHDVLEYMITYDIASQYASSKNLTVTDDEVQTEIDSILNDSFGGDQSAFDSALQQQGLTMDQLKQSYKESMLLQKVYDDVTKDVTTVPDSDIQAYYDAHKTDYFIDETRTARHILIAPIVGRVDGTTSTTTTSSTTSTTASSSTGASDSSTTSSETPTASSSTTTTAAPTQADWDAALETANKVRADLVAGADWTVEAKTYSDDPGSKGKGGDLGTISKGEMVQEFEDAVFSLKQDEISQPVKTAYGYHIIQVTGITPANQQTLDEVKDEITSSLLSDKKSQTWLSWIDQQKQQIGVTYSDDWAPATTTTTAAPSTTTSLSGDTATTAPSSDTNVAPSSTTTTAGATITTAAPATTSSSAP